ncbi:MULTISPECIES: phosphatidylinositol mannoside acyltransferase [Dactylosporangium]|uniref:Lipid A biosynthesis lauroyl acyltransferase n=2 Tax=Dactylosporangium TaxID=35753 RepID=A0A9W6KJV0_9ACTN|nr:MULTISPECIES: phosphatidylinositol mannoside acyltransferase [Dactylosporangium]UAB94699.1 phosphatidylinositol mannoside acyltransferase [Dactylosporangium vinaceum]UWZ43068.1 phosphatidylinositol mannoside acyltransferase [Dactylosporangium matsuzakiense]GLL02523.1 lipid A biosynthesis lauroyl acyltransferase [Dactylosporangium matsuzakiense]
MNLVELGYGAAFNLLPRLPHGAVWPLFAAAAANGHRGYRRGKPGRGTATLAQNLRRVVGPDMPEEEFSALLHRALRSYARYYLEAFRLPGRTREQILSGFRLERGELLGQNHEAGIGSVVALPHAGNWDAAGAWVAAKGWPITTVAERLKPESVYLKFLAFRRSLGMEILPLTGGERPTFDVLEERLTRDAAVVPLLADRDLTPRGVDVEFFGGRTRMPAGPALLALRTGAPLYVVDMWFDADAAAGYLAGPIPMPGTDEGSLGTRVRIVTQRVADTFAEGIARHPEDWHMLQRFWLDQPAVSTVA